mmetsp:Transcript_21369/g.59432  ORF Transcript_21369/g.59432 Transcript_21369/m.59432 type:complete len:1337 (-) Transcript_21369:81-4091(-)|eukprot:CAMPEP_0172377302 /NCGR_PEP_ID=MMETSP1060-20121228/68835_1 /TAXON_ID=37318 /ORGANISM="Pseudo-nitzschia pungens, Strain cf. cingulata" /LENGTH=1336 /DNA_ID=CAMNT_0013104983 /DNA_START=59 /DNA_END=4069 /DNA_ORIENTATION=+
MKLLSLKIPSPFSSKRSSKTVSDKASHELSIPNGPSIPSPVLEEKASDDSSLFSGLPEGANISPPPPPKGTPQPKGILRASSHTGPSSSITKNQHSKNGDKHFGVDSESTLGNSSISSASSSRLKGTLDREIPADPSSESLESELLKTIKDIACLFPDGDTNTLMTWGSANDMPRPIGTVKLVSSVQCFGDEDSLEQRNDQGEDIGHCKSNDSGSGIAEILDELEREFETDLTNIGVDANEVEVIPDCSMKDSISDASAIRIDTDAKSTVNDEEKTDVVTDANTENVKDVRVNVNNDDETDVLADCTTYDETDVLADCITHDDDETDVLAGFKMAFTEDRSEIQHNEDTRTINESEEGTEVLADFNSNLMGDDHEQETDENDNSYIENDEGTEILADFNRHLMSRSVDAQPKEVESKYILTPCKARKMQQLLERARAEVEILHGNNGQYKLEIERMREEHKSELRIVKDRGARELDELKRMHQNEIEDILKEKNAAVAVARDVAARFAATEKKQLKMLKDEVEKVKKAGARELSEAIEKERQVAKSNKEKEISEKLAALRKLFEVQLKKMRRDCDERVEIEVEEAIAEAHRCRLQQDGLVSRLTIQVDDLRKDRDSIFQLLKQAKRKFNMAYPEEMTKFQSDFGFTEEAIDDGAVSYRNGEEALKDLMNMYAFLLANAEKKAISAKEWSEIDSRKRHVLRQRDEIEQLKKDKAEKNEKLRKMEENFKALRREKCFLEERYKIESENHKLELKRLGNEKQTFINIERSCKDLKHAMAKGQRELTLQKEIKDGEKVGKSSFGNPVNRQKILPKQPSSKRTGTDHTNNFDRFVCNDPTPATRSSRKTIGFSGIEDRKDSHVSSGSGIEKDDCLKNKPHTTSSTIVSEDTARDTKKKSTNVKESSLWNESRSLRRSRSLSRVALREDRKDSNQSSGSGNDKDNCLGNKPQTTSSTTASKDTSDESQQKATSVTESAQPNETRSYRRSRSLSQYARQRDTATESNSKSSSTLVDGTPHKSLDEIVSPLPKNKNSSMPTSNKKQGDAQQVSTSKPLRSDSFSFRNIRTLQVRDVQSKVVSTTNTQQEKESLDATHKEKVTSSRVEPSGIILQRMALAGRRSFKPNSEEEKRNSSMEADSSEAVKKDAEESNQESDLLRRARQYRSFKDDSSRRSVRSVDDKVKRLKDDSSGRSRSIDGKISISQAYHNAAENASSEKKEEDSKKTKMRVTRKAVDQASHSKPPGGGSKYLRSRRSHVMSVGEKEELLIPPPPPPNPPRENKYSHNKVEAPREVVPFKESPSHLNLEKPPLSSNVSTQSKNSSGKVGKRRFAGLRSRARVRKI